MRRPEFLIVDDDAAMREVLVSLLREHNYVVREVSDANAALDLIRETDFDAVVSELKMPGKGGIDMAGELHRVRPDTPLILMTALGSIDSAVEAMRAGAFDSITKPFEPAAVLLTAERAVERRRLEEENQQLRRAVDRTSRMGDLIGESAAMRDIFALIKKVAHRRSSVLITGERGTGKEVVARTLHYAGARADSPFVAVHCTASPEGLLESELFGHVKGAFRGADTSNRGLFEKADGGTLFLDEIGDLGLGMQGKLLRVLQDGEIRPVGGTRNVKVDVRIISASHRDLGKEVEAGRFHEDLFYRLNVIPVHIPPLRERKEDIPALIEAFVDRHAEGRKRALSVAAVERLQAWPWKGNAQELENVIERTLALTDVALVDVEDLPLGSGANGAAAGSLFTPESVVGSLAAQGLSLHDIEELYTDEVLRLTGGNKVRATKILGIDRKTLYRRLERRRRAEATRTAQA